MIWRVFLFLLRWCGVKYASQLERQGAEFLVSPRDLLPGCQRWWSLPAPTEITNKRHVHFSAYWNTFLLKVIVVRNMSKSRKLMQYLGYINFFISILQGKTNYLAYAHNLLILSALQYPVHKTLSCVHDLFSSKHNIILHKIGSMK